MFLNLIINAARSIEEGQVDRNRITIRTWARGEDVFASVEDTGQGIPAENLERIFEPFFSTRVLGAGSGLGLAICRNLITELGGTIGVESEVSRGTRFLIRLPAHAAKTSEPVRAEAAPARSLVRGRVLVVDDEDPIRRVLVRLVAEEHEVVAVSSGLQAQALLEKDPAFDVILCDLMMPEMSGMDLHAWLAARHPSLAARVVFISGGAFTPSAEAYVASVNNLRVDKPFDRATLKRIVGELVEAARKPG